MLRSGLSAAEEIRSSHVKLFAARDASINMFWVVATSEGLQIIPRLSTRLSAISGRLERRTCAPNRCLDPRAGAT